LACAREQARGQARRGGMKSEKRKRKEKEEKRKNSTLPREETIGEKIQ
jgi:hypothetical protein